MDQENRSNTRTSAEKTILLVDDDPDLQGVLAELIEREGYRVLRAGNGKEALTIARTEHIHLFLTDIEMPGMTGIRLCRRIRRMERFRATPIVVLTGMQEPEALSEAFSAGCDDFIEKPVNTVALQARLRGHIQRMEYFENLVRTRRLLDRYLSKRTREMVDRTARTGSPPPPEQRDVVIVFTDIRGFTALAEHMDPGQLFSLLSAQLAEQVHLIHEHGGYVDKYGGDGLMAVFDGLHRVSESCQCALDIIESARHHSRGDEGIQRLGIGINTGHVVIGNIGSPEHLDYSVVGTTVNLAARLCGHAEPMSIVVSQQIRNKALEDPRFAFHSERRVTIRGIKEPLTVYSLSSSEKPAPVSHAACNASTIS